MKRTSKKTSVKAKKVIDLTVVDSKSSEGANSPTANASKERTEIVLSGDKKPITASAIITPKYVGYDGLLAIYLLMGWGKNKWFPNVNNVGVLYTAGMVSVTDEEVDPKGQILVCCGEKNGFRSKFNPGNDEGVRDEEVSAAAAVFKYLELDGEKYLKRLVDDAVLSRALKNVPETTLARIIQIHPAMGEQNEELLAWIWQAFRVLIQHEKMPLDIKQGELTLNQFYDIWLKGRPHVQERTATRMREQMEASTSCWRDHPMELATITHAFQSCDKDVGGKDLQETLDWLTTAFDAMADAQSGFQTERERLEKVSSFEVQAMKKIVFRNLRRRGADKSGTVKIEPKIITKKFKVMIVDSANKFTANAAFSLGIDFVVAIRGDGRFAMFMFRPRTSGFNLRPAAKMLRFLVRAKKGEANEARRVWDAMGCTGEYPGVDGIYFDDAEKRILNGTEKTWAPKVPINRSELEEIAMVCHNEDQVVEWNIQKLRRYATRRR